MSREKIEALEWALVQCEEIAFHFPYRLEYVATLRTMLEELKAPAPKEEGREGWLTREQVEGWRGITAGFMDPAAEAEFNRLVDMALASLTSPTDAEAVRDKARLDWLSRPQPSGTAFRFLMCNRGCWAVVDPEVDIPVEDWEPGPRSAIDAAMSKAALATPAPSAEGWLDSPALMEALADVEHQRWAGWQSFVFGHCCSRIDGRVVILDEMVERWKRQITTPYAALSESEKESDRCEVRKTLAVLRSFHAPTAPQQEKPGEGEP